MTYAGFESTEKIISILKDFQEKLKNTDHERKILKLYSVLTKCCSLDGLNKSEDIPYDENDFALIAENKLPYLKSNFRILQELASVQTSLGVFVLHPKTVEEIFVESLIIAGQFKNSENYWSNEECALVSDQILDSLLQLSECSNLNDFITGKEGCEKSNFFCKLFPNGILKLFLSKFSLKITKETWKNYPSYMNMYKWILDYVKAPHLVEHTPYLLPPALFMVDDWEQKNKIHGVESLHHILLNTTASELRLYGRAEVIYEALKHNLYSREAKLLQVTYPAVILAASVIDKDPKNNSHFKNLKEDAVLDHLLREMSHEEKLSLRTVYCGALKQLISSMGILILRWSGKVLEICGNYLETFEGDMAQDRVTVLEVLQIYINHCWPRVHYHAETILRMVLKLVYEINSEELQLGIKEMLLTHSKTLLDLLSAAAPETVGKLCAGISESKILYDESMKFVLSNVIEECS